MCFKIVRETYNAYRLQVAKMGVGWLIHNNNNVWFRMSNFIMDPIGGWVDSSILSNVYMYMIKSNCSKISVYFLE